jgi:hypothetical protein
MRGLPARSPQALRGIEYGERGQGSEQRDEGDGACPSGNRIRRRDERRKSRRIE